VPGNLEAGVHGTERTSARQGKNPYPTTTVSHEADVQGGRRPAKRNLDGGARKPADAANNGASPRRPPAAYEPTLLPRTAEPCPAAPRRETFTP
jgi:hypothetical protein